jgi:hypothetical protein
VRRLRRLGILLVALAAIIPAAAAPNSVRSAAPLPSGFWHPEPSQPLNIDVTESLPNGGCEQIIGIQQVGQQGVVIQNVTGEVTVKPDTPLPHVGFVGLTANPAVGPGGMVQFTLALNVALPPSTVVTVANFPQCGVGTGSEGFDLVFASTSPPPPPPPPPPAPKKTPNLDKAEAKILAANTAEGFFVFRIAKEDLAAARAALGSAVAADEIPRANETGIVKLLDEAVALDRSAVAEAKVVKQHLMLTEASRKTLHEAFTKKSQALKLVRAAISEAKNP